MATNSVMQVEQILPRVVEFTPGDAFGSDYYGALHVAAAYCGFKLVPGFYAGMWQHGCIPPWQQLCPELVTYGKPATMPCWVARADEESYLRGAGYTRARAIGLPIVYTAATAARRLEGSLLVMPPHAAALFVDKEAKDSSEYVKSIGQIGARFSQLAACVSAPCMEHGLWVSLLQGAGIEAIRGASLRDANSLKRMRALFETFEFVTTPEYGSHVAYALYFGAKVSLWGTPPEPLTKESLRGETWKKFPQASERYCSQETLDKQEELLGRFRVEPWAGIADRELGAWLVGHDRKLSPAELRQAFRWGPGARAYHFPETVWRRARRVLLDRYSRSLNYPAGKLLQRTYHLFKFRNLPDVASSNQRRKP